MRGRGDARPEVDGYEVAGALFYHPRHLWARVEDEGRVRVGLDDFARKLTGRIESVWLPEVGTSINRGEACWRVTHAAGEIALTAPVTGTLVEVNERLAAEPSLINLDPYDKGWAMLIQPTRLEECLRTLFYGSRARLLFEQDIEKLNQRLSHLLTGSPVGATMQDGGAIVADFMSILAAGQARQLIDSFLSVPATLSSEAAELTKGR
jgi:glycine cleavage system H protein